MTGWIIGYTLGIVVVLAVVVLVVTITLEARSVAARATEINDSLQESVRHTAALAQLSTTIEHAGVITAGLARGRARLGG